MLAAAAGRASHSNSIALTPMPTVPPPQPQPRPLRSRRRRTVGLTLTALVAGIFGIGIGTALRFQVVPATADSPLNPEQAFPPLADWPPKPPRASRTRRQSDAPAPRRLLPAAEAATSRPATDIDARPSLPQAESTPSDIDDTGTRQPDAELSPALESTPLTSDAESPTADTQTPTIDSEFRENPNTTTYVSPAAPALYPAPSPADAARQPDGLPPTTTLRRLDKTPPAVSPPSPAPLDSAVEPNGAEI